MTNINQDFINKYKESLPFYIEKIITDEEIDHEYNISKGKQKRNPCVIRDGEEIRELCKFQMKQLSVSTDDLESVTGVSKNTITNFLFSRKRYSIPQRTVLSIADILGINLHVQWSTNPFYNKQEAKNKIKDIIKTKDT
jgi:hypothetical protein